jgi:hypothetical protein
VTELYWARYVLAMLLLVLVGAMIYLGVFKRPAKWR